jgi:hypothetical protein
VGGQPWLELELHRPAMGSSQERGGEGGEEAWGATGGGARLGGHGGRSRGRARPAGCFVLAVHEK